MRTLIKRYPVLAFFVLITALGWLAVFTGTTWMPIDEEHEINGIDLVVHAETAYDLHATAGSRSGGTSVLQASTRPTSTREDSDR